MLDIRAPLKMVFLQDLTVSFFSFANSFALLFSRDPFFIPRTIFWT